MTKWVLIFLIAITFESIGLVFLKKGMMRVPDIKPLSVTRALEVARAAATNGQVLTGVFFQALFFISLLALMTQTDISFLWPLTGLGFVVATVAGIVFLHEQVSAVRWIGVLLSMVGATMIAASGHPNPPGEAKTHYLSEPQQK